MLEECKNHDSIAFVVIVIIVTITRVCVCFVNVRGEILCVCLFSSMHYDGCDSFRKITQQQRGEEKNLGIYLEKFPCISVSSHS